MKLRPPPYPPPPPPHTHTPQTHSKHDSDDRAPTDVRSGDILVCNHQSFVDILVLDVLYAPVFALVALDVRRSRNSGREHAQVISRRRVCAGVFRACRAP
jgi:hypothetical protein